MKTKRYPHVTGLYGDEGENPGALAVNAVLDPSPNYPEAGRIIVVAPETTPTIPGYIPNLGGFNGGPAAIERLAGTLLEAARDVRAVMGSTTAPPIDDDTRVIDDPDAPAARLDLDDIERKAKAVAGALPRTQRIGQYARAMAEAPITLALIARIRELEAETAHQHNVMSEHATICNKRVAGIEAIAKTATEFIDEQGPRASEDLLLHPDFASAHWEELVRAVEGAGR